MTGTQPLDRSLADLINDSGLPSETRVSDLREKDVTSRPVSWHATKPLTGDDRYTLGDVAELSDEELLQLPGLGERRLVALKNAVLGAENGAGQ